MFNYFLFLLFFYSACYGTTSSQENFYFDVWEAACPFKLNKKEPQVDKKPKKNSVEITGKTKNLAKNFFKKGLFKAYIASGKNLAKEHIKKRHWYNANQVTPTSRFRKSMTMRKLNKLATITLNQGTQRVGKNGRWIHEHTFKKPLGLGMNGKPAYILRVITEPKQAEGESLHVVTVFPVN